MNFQKCPQPYGPFSLTICLNEFGSCPPNFVPLQRYDERLQIPDSSCSLLEPGCFHSSAAVLNTSRKLENIASNSSSYQIPQLCSNLQRSFKRSLCVAEPHKLLLSSPRFQLAKNNSLFPLSGQLKKIRHVFGKSISERQCQSHKEKNLYFSNSIFKRT